MNDQHVTTFMQIRFAYHTLSKPDKGLLLTFLPHVSGYSLVQVKPLSENTFYNSRCAHSATVYGYRCSSDLNESSHPEFKRRSPIIQAP